MTESRNVDLEDWPRSVAPRLAIAGGWRQESIVFMPQPDPPIPTQSVSVDCWYPADADAVVDQQIQQGNEDDPFWCYLWPTARTLAQQVFRSLYRPVLREQYPSLRVLETGCGIGLVGLAALAAGSTTVTFQDLRSQSVDLALHNAQVNGFGDRARGQVVDWQSPPNATFDWVIASDVLYHLPAHASLLHFLEKAICSPHNPSRSPAPPLAAPPGSIWIGDPGRREAEDFIQLAQSRFKVYVFDQDGRSLSVLNHGAYQLIVLFPYP